MPVAAGNAAPGGERTGTNKDLPSPKNVIILRRIV
jgi:hypothetical protein